MGIELPWQGPTQMDLAKIRGMHFVELSLWPGAFTPEAPPLLSRLVKFKLKIPDQRRPLTARALL